MEYVSNREILAGSIENHKKNKCN